MLKKWKEEVGLFLFDFDGLLVDTERLHFQAYKNVLADYGFSWDLDFSSYMKIAYYEEFGLKKALLKRWPTLPWEELYLLKRKEVTRLLEEDGVPLMLGVFDMLTFVQEASILACVVTHSSRASIDAVKKRHPILNTIPFWFTREDYHLAKPHPEGYLKAIALHRRSSRRIVGFEDTPKGLFSLLGTEAQPVLVSSVSYEELPVWKERGVIHLSSFSELFTASIF